MLVIERDRIQVTGAIVRWADTGKQFPEMALGLTQIQEKLGIEIVTVAPRITFDEYLFERGGMIRKGTNDCSRRMKRSNLARHLKQFPRPYEVNLGFNAKETDRADAFIDRNERNWLHWRFPLIEAGITREMTWKICEDAGFTILVHMYRTMGRFDCFWCGNQTARQALKVNDHYPELAAEWKAAEERKGHSFRTLPLSVLVEKRDRQGLLDFESNIGCACFGGNDNIADEIEAEAAEQLLLETVR